MNLRGTSMFAFMTYAKTNLPNGVVTRFNSEAKENGAIAWSQMTFNAVRKLTSNEATEVQAKIDEIKQAVEAEKSFYATKDTSDQKADKEYDAIGSGDVKKF